LNRALVVLDGLRLGGAERQAIVLARGLSEACGVDARIVGFQGPGTAAALCEKHGVPWSVLPFVWERKKNQRIRQLLGLAMEMRSYSPQLVLPYTMKPNVACGLVWRLTGARLCMWNQRDEGRQRLPPRWERLAVKLTPWFASNSQHGAEFVIGLGAPPDRMRVIHNGVLPEPPRSDRAKWRSRLDLEETAFVATMVANLHGYKDHATLLNAWRVVVDHLQTGSTPTLLLAGTPENTALALKAQAFDLELGRSVRFLGAVEDVSGLLLASDCCVFSSQFEGVPNGVLEGMAAGLAVVATDIPGIREAVGDSRCAILTPPGDAERMAEAILEVARNPAQARAMGRAGQERIRQEFTPEKMVRESVEWIEEGLRRVGR